MLYLVAYFLHQTPPAIELISVEYQFVKFLHTLCFEGWDGALFRGLGCWDSVDSVVKLLGVVGGGRVCLLFVFNVWSWVVFCCLLVLVNVLLDGVDECCGCGVVGFCCVVLLSCTLAFGGSAFFIVMMFAYSVSVSVFFVICSSRVWFFALILFTTLSMFLFGDLVMKSFGDDEVTIRIGVDVDESEAKFIISIVLELFSDDRSIWISGCCFCADSLLFIRG